MLTNTTNNLWEWGKALLIALLVVGAVRYFVFTPIVVDGQSMMPTLNSGDRMIVNKLGEIERFDIIVFHTPENKNYIKRVIGLPGDKIEYIDDELYINGKHFEEPYLEKYKQKENHPFTETFTLEEKTGLETVPEGELFVLGDNRLKSKDSRAIGTIKISDVIGKTNLVIWPFQQIKLVH